MIDEADISLGSLFTSFFSPAACVLAIRVEKTTRHDSLGPRATAAVICLYSNQITATLVVGTRRISDI